MPSAPPTQRFFSPDGPSGRERYRLLPLPGWRILLAKDLAFLLVLAPLLWPFSLTSGLASALAALGTGHFTSLRHRSLQVPWRFATGASLNASMLQTVIVFAAEILADRHPTQVIPMVLAFWIGSLIWCGRGLDRM